MSRVLDARGAGAVGASGAAGAGDSLVVRIAAGRRKRQRRHLLVCAGLALLVLIAFAASLMVGKVFYGPGEVLGVLLGQDVQGAGFTVGVLRLPRALLALLAGLAFGIAGTTFQTLLRNPLASPDIIGISSGASAAAVVSIVLLSLSGMAVSVVAMIAALTTAALIYLLSFKDGLSGTRLILIGIGIAAMLNAVVHYTIARAPSWDLQTSMRWLNGNLNNAQMVQVVPLAIAVVLCAAGLLCGSRALDTLRLGEDTAAALGVGVERTRMLLILLAVVLLAFATAAAGPIAFVAFLSGPIAGQIVEKAGGAGSSMLPAGLVGALLVLVADLVGQFAFDTRFPVGVITGALGAPYLMYLLIRSARAPH